MICKKCDWGNQMQYGIDEVVDFYQIEDPKKWAKRKVCYGCFGDMK